MARTMAFTGLHGGLRERHRRAQLASDRRAGAHSRREVRRLQLEWVRRNWPVILVTLLTAAVGVALVHTVMDSAVAPVISGGLVASACWWLYSLMLLTGNVASHLTGILGEEWTTDELRKLRREGWQFVNHVMMQRSDVDHVLLGRGGFYAIETKFRSDWGAHHVDLDQIACQARNGARATNTRIDHKRDRVQPLVVLWGPGVTVRFPDVFEHDGVTFCPGHLLREFIQIQPSAVPSAEVNETFDMLLKYVDKRQVGEILAYGEIPRSLSQANTDLAVVTAAFLASLVMIVAFVGIGPEGVWSGVTAAALTGLAVLARRNWPRSPRVQRTTTAVITTALASGVVLAVGSAWVHLFA